MNKPLPFIPEGYRLVRPLSVREGSWVFLATGPNSAWCCLKLQQTPRTGSFAALVAARGPLRVLSHGTGMMPLTAWGADHASGTLWEEMPLADDLLTEAPFASERSETYTPFSLVSWLTERGPASTGQVIAWGLRLSQALVDLHAAGLLHRDVKPANILFSGGLPVLADYGSIGGEGASIEFPGTEGYVPPDGLGSPALDVFALGRTLYELWTGLDRFRFPSLPAAVTQNADWDTHGWLLNDVLLLAAEGRPSRRFATVAQLHAALSRAAPGRRRISRRKFVGVAAAAVGGIGAAYVWRNRPSHRAVWRRLPPARFGFELWQGTELTYDWANRTLYSLSSDYRGSVLQSYDLRPWKRSVWEFPKASQRIQASILMPEEREIWGVESVTGKVNRVKTDGSSVTPIAGNPLDQLDFTGRIYWNPFTGRIGMFGGYGLFHVHNRLTEFDPKAGEWQPRSPAGPFPWPRREPFLFPGRDRKSWFLFGGYGNLDGRQGKVTAGLSGYDGQFYPLDDLWSLDLAADRWKPLLPVQRWRPGNLKSAIYHPRLDAVLFLTGSVLGKEIPAALHLWAGDPGKDPKALPSVGDVISMFRLWTLLVEPESQDLWVFADEGVFAVTLQPA